MPLGRLRAKDLLFIACPSSSGFYEQETSAQISVRVFELTTFRSIEFELSNYPGALEQCQLRR
jgi:hypothetical protein